MILMVLKRVKQYGNCLCVFLNKKDGFKLGDEVMVIGNNVTVAKEPYVNSFLNSKETLETLENSDNMEKQEEPQVNYVRDSIEIRELDITMGTKIAELEDKMNYVFKRLESCDFLVGKNIINTGQGTEKISLDKLNDNLQYLKNTYFNHIRIKHGEINDKKEQ